MKQALIVGVLIAIASCAAAAAAGMAETAEGFYAVYAGFRPSQGIPDKAALAKYAPYLSPALAKLLDEAAATSERFASDNKDSPPLVEGDLFTSMFEGATSTKVGSCKGDAHRGTCSIGLSYDDGKGPPVRWTDTLYLVMTPQGWRVDDIGYGGNLPFSNKGRLTETLRQVISDAGS